MVRQMGVFAIDHVGADKAITQTRKLVDNYVKGVERKEREKAAKTNALAPWRRVLPQAAVRRAGPSSEPAAVTALESSVKPTRCLLGAGAVAMFLGAAPGWALDSVEARALKLYGGTYSTDCANPAAPRLRATTDALMVEQGGKRLTGSNVQAAYTYFGSSPPPDYQVVLLSEVKPGVALEFIVYRDKTGLYITLDGDPIVQAALGNALLGKKYRHCDAGGRQQQAAAPPPVPIPSPAPATKVPADLLNDPKFKSAYYMALGGNVKQRWLAKLDGPAPPVRRIALGGAEYLLASVCKPHDCADNNTVLLYTPTRQAVYGKIFQRGGTTWIGAPPGDMVPELERLWRAEWRKGDS